MKRSVTVEELLGSERSDAVERLSVNPDSGPMLHQLLQKASRKDTQAADAALIVALVLAKAPPRSDFVQFLEMLVSLLLDDACIPREPEDRAALQIALDQIDRQQEALRDNKSASPTIATVAHLYRIRARLAGASGDFDSGQALFRKAIQLYEESGDSPSAVAATIETGLMFWHNANNFDGATAYLVHAADQLGSIEPREMRDALSQALVRHLVEKALHLHYEERNYPLAIRLARRAVLLSPNEVLAWRVLSNALSFTGKYEGALEAYRRLADLDPNEENASRANLAVALVKLQRYEEALQAVEDSLRLRPGQIRPMVLRGQLLVRANQPERAITDLETVIDLLEADRPADSDDPTEKQRYREHWSMWLAAYHNLIELHRQRDDRKALEATLTRLKATGDDALAAMGHRISGDIARKEGRAAEARREYDAALREFEYDTEARLSRALLLAEAGDVQAAIDDLAQLAPRSADPKKAIDGFNRMADLFPEEPRIRYWLGFSYYELGAFDSAEEHLEHYLERVPNDAEARKWFGLSLISMNPDKKDPQADGKRCFRGMEELAQASSDRDGEAREALLWVIDRLILKFGFDSFFLARSKPILNALPILTRLLKSLETAQWGDRDYPLRSDAFRDCIAIGTDLGLPCFVAYMHALLADIELLQGNIQSASEHAREAKKLGSLAMAPRSRELEQQYQQMQPELGDRALEIEHEHIYDKAVEALQIVELTVARVQAAAGNADQANAALGDIASIMMHVDRIPMVEATVIAQTLRDANRAEDAIAVLDRAEKRHWDHSDDLEKASLLMARATILAKEGHIKEAIEAARTAEPLLDEERKWVVWFNIAAFADAGGAHSEALEILNWFDIDTIARSDEDHFRYHLLRASALDGSGQIVDAQEASLKAITILESMRRQRRDLQLRASWSHQQATVYEIAIRTSVRNGDLSRAFDLVEQSRSRLLIDEMAVGLSIEDREGIGLEQELRSATEKQDLLARLMNAADVKALPPEIFVRLKALDPELSIVQLDDTGIEQLSPEGVKRAYARNDTRIALLREKIGDHRLQSAERLYGDLTDFESCRNTLAEVGPAVLVELVVLEESCCAFVVRSDFEAPHVETILLETDIAEWAQRLIKNMTRPWVEPAHLKNLQSPIQPLLDAIEKTTEAGEIICIVPHSVLHHVPFPAFQMEDGFLIERNPIVYAPSASVLSQILMREDGNFGDRAVVVGNTRGDLPHAEQEAAALTALLGADPVPRHNATRRQLIEKLSAEKRLNILHLACHGYFDHEDALSSGILTADADTGGKPVVLSARDLLEIHLETNLVGLSACDSAFSEVGAGDELMGLTRALLLGGARSVLGSLWKINDLSTSILMRYFYDAWVNKGQSKIQALRSAQCHLMHLTRSEAQAAISDQLDVKPRDSQLASSPWFAGSNPDEAVFASPLYWAAFTLVGDWR